MSALDRGIRVNSQSTEILLNNRLFETPQGSLLFTTRVSPPLAGEVGKTHALLQGGDGSYIKVNIIYGPNTFQFEVAANTGSTSISGPVSVSPAIPYNQEVTLGAVYNSSSGLLSSSVRVVGGTIQASDQAAGGPPTLAWTNSAIRTLPSQADSALSIGLRQFNGFVGKLATYDKAFDLAKPDFNNYVNNPLIWPAQGRLHLLDSTQILGVSSVNTTVPETQTLTFGNALATGLITIGGIEVLVERGDSGPVVAEKVQAKLVADNLYKVQAEKQKLTFEPLSGSTVTPGSISVDGVTVSLTNVNDRAVIATDVETALKAAYAETNSTAPQKLRIVQKNADHTVTITFAESEKDASLISVSSNPSAVAVSVDTVLPYSASALGRTVARDGNKLLITFNRYDENIEDFATNSGYAKFLVNTGSTGVTVSSQESTPHIPSAFTFKELPQGKVQKISIVTHAGGTAAGDDSKVSITNAFTNDRTATAVHVTVDANASDSKIKLAELVALKLNEAAAATQTDGGQVYPSKIKGAVVDPTNAEAVLVTFHPGAGQQAHVVFFAGAASPANANIATVSNFAQGARGEIQSVSFANGTGSFVIDDQPVTFTGTTASQAALEARTALEKKNVVAEVKTLTFSDPNPALTGSPKVIVFGHEIPVVTGANAVAIATAVKQYFSNGSAISSLSNPVDKKILAASPFSDVSFTGNTVTFTYKTTVAHPDDKSLWSDNGGVTATVAQTTAFNGNTYSTGAVQTLNLKTLDPGASTLEFKAANAGAPLTSGPISLTGGPFTANEVALQVAGALQAQIGQSAGTSLGNLLSAVVPDGDSIHFYFKNSVRQPSSDQTIKAFGVGSSTTFTGIQGFDATSGLATLLPISGTAGYPATTTQFYNAEGRHKLSVNGDVLRIEFSPSEGDVKPVLVNTTGSSVKAAVSTLRPAHEEPQTVSIGYSGGGGNGTSANVLYTQLKTAGSATSETKSLEVNVFIDRSKAVAGANDFGPGVESVSFTLTYNPVLMSDADPTVVIPSGTSGSSVFNINRAAGEITFSLTRNESFADLSKPIATVTFNQKKVANSFAKAIDFGFKRVDIDGISFTGNSFNTEFSSRVQVDRWDIESTLVNALNTALPVAGQVVAFYGNPSPVQGQQLSLKFQTISDPANARVSTSASKVVTLSVDSNASTTNTASFTITLPSNVTAASFTPAQGVTATSTKAGRSLEVTVSNAGGKPQGSSLGTITAEVQQATNLTHEFGFAPGSVRVNTVAPAPGGDGQPVYLGFTITNSQGKWQASDMPLGSFNKVAFPTAAVPALDKIITAADALDILRLSAGFEPNWISDATRPAFYVAADIDGSGNITAADALAALRIAAGVSTNATPGWKFIDAATQGLGVSNARPASLNQNMPVSGTAAPQKIDSSTNSDFQVKAVFVGNVTQPVPNEYPVS